MTDERLGRLADAVRHRRGELRLSKEAAARAAGMSSITWKRVEDGLAVRDVTYAAIERTLGWQPGDVDRIRAGGTPRRAGDTVAGEPDEYDDAIAKVRALRLSDQAKRTLVAVIESMRGDDGPAGEAGQGDNRRTVG